MNILIKNVRVVDCTTDFYGDVYIENGIISQIGKDIDKACQTIEGKGLILLPSFIDLHVHFRDPGLTYKEDIETGSMASVKGGYTAVNLMANTNPICSSMETVDYVLDKAKKIGLIDVHQCVSITNNMEGKDVSHLDNVNSSIVRLISDDGKGVLDDKIMLEAMEKSQAIGFTIISHAENSDITPLDSRLSENIMTVRDIAIAKHTCCNLHVAHVSTIEAMKEIIAAKKDCNNITCEVTPHHIALYDTVDYRVNPPIRRKKDVDYLISAIKSGFVDAISTDHAPHSALDKQKGAPGISGIETAFSVCYTTLVKNEHIKLSELSGLMSANPARIMKMNKGHIKIGYDGDVVLVDINKNIKVDSNSFASKGKNTPFDGFELFGEVLMTIKGGKVVYKKEDTNDN